MTQEPDVARSNAFTRRFAKVLRDLGILLGPATVIGMVCQVMDFPGRVTAEVAICMHLDDCLLQRGSF